MLRDYPERFFECGWAWGVAQDATEIDLPADGEPQSSRKASPSHVRCCTSRSVPWRAWPTCFPPAPPAKDC